MLRQRQHTPNYRYPRYLILGSPSIGSQCLEFNNSSQLHLAPKIQVPCENSRQAKRAAFHTSLAEAEQQPPSRRPEDATRIGQWPTAGRANLPPPHLLRGFSGFPRLLLGSLASHTFADRSRAPPQPKALFAFPPSSAADTFSRLDIFCAQRLACAIGLFVLSESGLFLRLPAWKLFYHLAHPSPDNPAPSQARRRCFAMALYMKNSSRAMGSLKVGQTPYHPL